MDEIKKILAYDDEAQKTLSEEESNNQLQYILSRIENNFPKYTRKIRTKTGFIFYINENGIVSVDKNVDGTCVAKGSVIVNVSNRNTSIFCLFNDFNEEFEKKAIELLSL